MVNIEKGRQKVLVHTFSVMLAALRVGADELLPRPQARQPASPSDLNHLPRAEQDFVRRGLKTLSGPHEAGHD